MPDQLTPPPAHNIADAAKVAARPSFYARLTSHIPPVLMGRYLIAGLFNTAFAYGTFAAALFFLNRVLPERYLYLTVMGVSIVGAPINITVSYFTYKFFVFKTRGNYLTEWLKCIAVYGAGMLPGILVLGALTKFLQSILHMPHAAGYLAVAIMQSVTVVVGFLGHKNITFRPRSAKQPANPAS